MDYEKIFRGIWLRLLNTNSYVNPNLVDVRKWAEGKGLSNVSVENVEAGVLVRIPAIE